MKIDDSLVHEVAQVIACSSGDLMLVPTISIQCAAIAVVAALLAAGVIPAEGTVTIDRGRWERVSEVASAAVDAICEDELGMIYWACTPGEHAASVSSLQSGDLDAIPAAPTGEGEA